jgi:hypothetical protein
MLPLQHTLLPILLPYVARIPYYGARLVTPHGETSSTHSGGKQGHNETVADDSKEHSHHLQNVDGMDVSSPFAHVLTAMLSMLALLCALFVPNVELILGLMGSTAAVGVGMVLPGAILLKIMFQHKDVSLLPWSLACPTLPCTARGHPSQGIPLNDEFICVDVCLPQMLVGVTEALRDQPVDWKSMRRKVSHGVMSLGVM